MLYGTFLGEKSPDIAQMYQSKARSWILFATDNLGKSMNVVFVDAEEASRSMLDKLTNLPTGSDSEQVMAEEEASCDKLSVTHGVK